MELFLGMLSLRIWQDEPSTRQCHDGRRRHQLILISATQDNTNDSQMETRFHEQTCFLVTFNRMNVDDPPPPMNHYPNLYWISFILSFLSAWSQHAKSNSNKETEDEPELVREVLVTVTARQIVTIVVSISLEMQRKCFPDLAQFTRNSQSNVMNYSIDRVKAQDV